MKVQLTINNKNKELIERFSQTLILVNLVSPNIDIKPISRTSIILDFDENNMEKKELEGYIDEVTSTILQILTPYDMEIKFLD